VGHACLLSKLWVSPRNLGLSHCARARCLRGISPKDATNAKTATAPEAKSGRGTTARSRDEEDLKQKMNSWTIGLAAGRLEGASIRFAAELARVVDDGDNMRVLPIVTRGPFDNVFDLL